MEVFEPAAGVEAVDGGGVAGDLLIGSEQLTAVDGIGTGGTELACSNVGGNCASICDDASMADTCG